MAGNGSEPRRSVISKVVAIVRSFDSGGSLTVTEIAQVADLPLSTVHRLAHELAAWGILHRRDDARFEAALRARCGGPLDRPLTAGVGGTDRRRPLRRDQERRAAWCARRPTRVVRGEDRREPAALGLLGRREASGACDRAGPGLAGPLTRGNRRPSHPVRTPQLHVLDRGHRGAPASCARRDQAAGDRGRVRRAAARPLRGRRSRLRTRRCGRRCSRGGDSGRSFGTALRRPRAHGCGSRPVPRSRTSRGSPDAGASRDAGAVHRTGGSAELTRDSSRTQQPNRTQTVSGRRSTQPALRPAGLSCADATPTAAVRSGVTVDPGRTGTDPGHLRCCDAVSSRESRAPRRRPRTGAGATGSPRHRW